MIAKGFGAPLINPPFASVASVGVRKLLTCPRRHALRFAARATSRAFMLCGVLRPS